MIHPGDASTPHSHPTPTLELGKYRGSADKLSPTWPQSKKGSLDLECSHYLYPAAFLIEVTISNIGRWGGANDFTSLEFYT